MNVFKLLLVKWLKTFARPITGDEDDGCFDFKQIPVAGGIVECVLTVQVSDTTMLSRVVMLVT
jgi:hypothetical protein